MKFEKLYKDVICEVLRGLFRLFCGLCFFGGLVLEVVIIKFVSVCIRYYFVLVCVIV